MVTIDRNTCYDDQWVIKKVENEEACQDFDCGDDDLNEYFHVDIINHRQQLLTETYCLRYLENQDSIIALLGFCNDSLQFNKIKDGVDIPETKRYRYLPAAKLTRFSVAKNFQRMNVGTHTLNLIKQFFRTDNRTGCRFITVDAYNLPNVIKFYEKNNFQLITDKDKNKDTRSMFFDLSRLEVV